MNREIYRDQTNTKLHSNHFPSTSITIKLPFHNTHNRVRLESYPINLIAIQQTVQTPIYHSSCENSQQFTTTRCIIRNRETSARLGVVHTNLHLSFLPFFSSVSISVLYLSAIEPLQPRNSST